MARDLFAEAGIDPRAPEGRDLFAIAGVKLPQQDAGAPRTIGQHVTDLGASALLGLTGISKVPAMLLDKGITGQWVGPGVEAIGEFEASINEQKSPQLRAKEQAAQQRTAAAGKEAEKWAGGGDGFGATAARILTEFGVGAYEAVKDPALLSAQLAQQGPLLGASRLGGLAADVAARGVAKAAPALAASRVGQAAIGAAGTAGAIGTGAALQGADIGTDAYQRLMALPASQWAQVDGFNDLAAEIGVEAAKSRMASNKAMTAAVQAGLASVLSTALPGGASVERALVGKGLSGASIPRAVGKAFVGEAVQEGVEEGYGALAANAAVQQVDPATRLSENVGGAAGQGAVLGGLMGGGASVPHAVKQMRDGDKPEPAQTPPAAGQPSGAIPAAEVLDEPKPTEAEKALEPRTLTDLDRVAEIDRALAAMPVQETGVSPERAALEQERADLSRNWPTTVKGQQTTFSTEAGARVDGQYALIEASDLQASHDTDLRPNPAYPADLQPRDRTRAASEAQIASIVGRLDPARLGQSATAADGAPIIGADGLVESGNARTIALQRVYRANGQKAENYKAWLREASAAVGLSPEQVDAMQQPVLVRVRTTPVNRAEFARQANASTVAAMSPVEQARADAARIDALDDLRPDDNGDFATSRDFIRRFVGRLPATEQPEMIDAGGQLSASGYARVRNAVLAKAYGDSPALTRMVESMDDNLRNVSRALMIAAPRVAQARAAIKAGRRFDADITPHLVGAVEELSRIKDAGGSVSDALAQTGLTGDERTPEARDLLAFLDENMRRPRRLAEFITAYFDALDAAGDPAQGSLMGEAEPPKTGDLMAAVRRKQGENDAAATAATTARNAGGGQPGKVTPAAPGAAGGSAAAPGGGRGAQGDAAAPAANVAPTAANAPYRAYLLTPSDREKLLRLFPPTHDRVIADHLSAQALDAMHLVKDGPATGEVVGVFDHHGMQALVVSVNGAEKTATGSYFHLSWSVDEGVRTRNIGPAIAEYGFDRLAKPIKLDLSAGPNYIAPARDRSPGAERRDGESDKEFAKRVIDKRSAPITLPEKHSLYFNTGGAQTIDIADLVSTKTDEENAQGAENGAKRMAAAAAGELSKRGPITVMPSESQPGKYEVVDGNGTLSSVARYGWKSLPATVVTRAEGARMKALDEIAETAKAAAKVTLIDGRPYDIARDNFDRKVSLPALLVSKVESGIVKVANELSDLYHRVKPAPQITAEQRADAEAKLLPRMLLAAQAKAEFDGKLLSIVKETGAIGQMLALIKAIGRAAEKMVVDEDGNVDGIKDLLRATIVVGHYDDAQAVVDAIRREFDVLRIKNRSMHDITGPKVAVEDRAKYAGYSDVMVNVTMPNGTVAEIQVNVPVMMAAKGGAGHRLYEAWRDQPKGSPLHSEIGGAMVHFYDAAFDAAKARLDAAQLRKFPSEIGATPPSLGRPLRGSSDSPSSDALKTEPSGKTTYSSPENDAKNSQPSGNLSGIFTGPSSTPSIVPGSGENPKEEWRAFAPETGTLGVPRAEMPQVRAALRPELFEFLQGRGIGHQRVSLPADSLKPTQAEYSPAKTESAGHLAEEQTDRAAVLVSSDGYVLDGHHRWLARAEAHQPVWAIQFDAPIGKLLDAVMQFPGTHVSKDSEGAVTPSARDLAVQDFKDAMGDLGDFLTRHLRAAIVTEADKPKLMPTLVKAADAAIRIVGTDLRRVIAWMRDSFRKNKGTLPGWNTIPATWYREAAEKALAGLEERGQQTGLFSEKEQGDAAGAVLGSIGPAEIYGTRLSTAPAGARSSGMELPAVQAVADRVAKALPGLPPVKVLASSADAPAPLREFIASRNAAGDVEGALHDGTIYLFADNLADEGRAEHVLAQHEAAHAGLRGLMDEAALQQSMRAIYATNAAVRRAARSMVDAGMSEAEATEEVLVDMPSAELATLKGWRAFVGRLRDGLRARGFERLAGMLDDWLAGNLTQQQRADLFAADLVRAARGFVARPQARRLADDAAEQGAWMDREAKARGFSDIDALVAADFALFDRIAQQWRAAHPAAALLSTGGGDPYARAVKAWKAALSRAPVRRGGPLPPAGEAINMPMPTVMLALGVKNPVLALPLRYLHGIVSKHPDLPRAALESLPELLSDPPVVFPAKDGGYRVVLDVRTAKDEPVVVGIGADGRIQTVTPLHDEAGSAGADRLAHMLDQELSKQGVKVYARNKEALASARASRGIGSGASDALAVSSVRAGPAIRALLRSSRDRAIVILRDSIVKRSGDFGPGIRLSSGAAATPGQAGSLTPAQRAEALIQNAAGTPKPLDAFTRMLTRVSGLERLTTMTYGLGARLIDRITPERVKAGLVSDYGVPEAVIDQRAMLQGRQREQLRDAGKLLEKLSTMTRAESRVAYEWMNGEDTRTADELMAELPAESVAVLRQVRALVDELSQEAVKLGQLDPEAFERHRFAYLRRSYFKHAAELTGAEKTARQRAISILGDQYRGRGISLAAPMRQIQNIAPEWWKRKLATGKADTSLKGEKFERLERRAPTGEGTAPIAGVDGERRPGRVMEVHYWPAGEPKPAKYADWDSAGTFEAINVKGGDVVLWRDFTKEERVKMGEIDEARYAIAKTLQRMIHDVEVGKYLRWLSRNHARNEGEPFAGTIVPASERYLDSFKPHEWVRVPDATIAGTNGVKKYGALAGKYLPGPIWNDLRQVVGGRFMPLGQTYHDILRLWKTSKTALSPAVHMNNVMANAIMADWHDVSAGHVAKALRIVLGASARDGRGVLGRAGNAAGGLGIADREVAREILTRYENSGGAIGGWVTQEIADEQLAPIVDALRRELATTATAAAPAEIGVYAALQHALHARFPLAWQAFKASRPASAVATDAKNLIDLYQAEDDVFRLAAWLKAKEGGASDADAGKVARRSFLDYSINAPWVQAMRSTAFPFISFSYRAVPMLLETAAKRPHKILKLMMVLGAINAIGGLLAGGGGDDEDKARKLLPDEKAGRIWGLVPKLIRMPWNDAHGSPVFLDIRRWIPVGDVLDLGQGHAALPLPPALLPGGPLAVLGEILANRSMFTGKPITLETDTATEQAGKIADHLWKAATPNVLGMPGTYATQGVADALRGRTDAFGRELSVPQALASSVGVKLGSYPVDVLRRNRQSEARAQIAEIDDQMRALTRQRATNRIDQDEYEAAMRRQNEKKRRVAQGLAEKVN